MMNYILKVINMVVIEIDIYNYGEATDIIETRDSMMAI